eukprot:COSAG05_NODE_6497_length_946_cov_78.301063_1_plen_66_part_01
MELASSDSAAISHEQEIYRQKDKQWVAAFRSEQGSARGTFHVFRKVRGGGGESRLAQAVTEMASIR